MNRGDLIFIATVDSFKNSCSISRVGSGFLQANQLDNFGSVKLDNFGSVKLDDFASVKLDPTPLSEQNQTINKIMVNWSGSEILAKPLSVAKSKRCSIGISPHFFSAWIWVKIWAFPTISPIKICIQGCGGTI
jgi:hypothetical protein